MINISNNIVINPFSLSKIIILFIFLVYISIRNKKIYITISKNYYFRPFASSLVSFNFND